MPREIKFRTWEPGHNFMNYAPSTLSVDDPQRRGVNEVLYGLRATLMQFTGLKDMKGVEIYEGDIVGFDKDECYTVEWCEYDDQTGFNVGFEDSLFVLGNIYQNPELRKV